MRDAISFHYFAVIKASLLTADVMLQITAAWPHASDSAVAAALSSAGVRVTRVLSANGTPWG